MLNLKQKIEIIKIKNNNSNAQNCIKNSK